MNRILAAVLIGIFLFAGTSVAQSGSQWNPVTVTDAAGRSVCIEKEPERVVSGYYISTSAVIALGKQDRLVGIEAKAGSRPIYSLAAPELLSLPSVGSVKQPDLEMVISLDPDLVILPMKLLENARTLEEMGIPVIVVNPESYEDLKFAIRLIAEPLGADASRLFAFYEDAENRLASITEGREKPAVYLAGNSSMLNTAGKTMYQNTLLEMAGGRNVAEGITDSYWTQINEEQLLVWNPEIIITAADAGYSAEDIYSDELLAEVPAVKDGKIYSLPYSPEAWDSPVPGAVIGSLWIASRLYPEVYSEADFMTDAARFYRTFYGFELTEERMQ